MAHVFNNCPHCARLRAGRDGYRKSLRDQFAMAALTGELSSQSFEMGEYGTTPGSYGHLANRCFAIADAMLAAREESDAEK